jgi:ribosomal protein L12E/L44/L45/RPP1/RPP2
MNTETKQDVELKDLETFPVSVAKLWGKKKKKKKKKRRKKEEEEEEEEEEKHSYVFPMHME